MLCALVALATLAAQPSLDPTRAEPRDEASEVGSSPDASANRVVPHLRAVRVGRAPIIDGRLDDDVWKVVPAMGAFRQKFPHEGAAPEEPTVVRVAYDDDALYVSIDCEQRRAPVDRRLTRRDRAVESDWVAVTLDTRRDGKSAFEFRVSAAGVLVDSIRFNDTEVSADWDENWEAASALSPHGWSAELRIPLLILRFAALPVQSWGLQVRRYVSQRRETDEWAYIPRSTAAEVSLYGKLDDLRALPPGGALEVDSFALVRARHRDARADTAAAGTDVTGSVGLDLRWHPSQQLTLDAALLPDFAQVESDEVILNLTNVERLYPEKRRFFLEGTDTFATPFLQLVYTRRLGRAAPAPELAAGERLADVVTPAPIYGALKLTGRIAERWEIGAMSAVTGPSRVTIAQEDGSRGERLVDPAAAFTVLRLRRRLPGNGHLGVLVTAVNRWGEDREDRPPAGDPCPDGATLPRRGRCSNDAYTAGLDWGWRSPSGDFNLRGQLAASRLAGGPPRAVADGTLIGPGDLGLAAYQELSKEGGTHWLWTVWGQWSGRRFDINDLGYDERANQRATGGEIIYRTLEPWGYTIETATGLHGWAQNNSAGLALMREIELDSRVTFSGFWQLKNSVNYRGRRFDDREIGDGTALERGDFISHELEVTTDPRARVSGHFASNAAFVRTGGSSVTADLGLTLRALPQLDVDLAPQVVEARGEPRFVERRDDGTLVFGHLHASSVGLTLRATYTFTPRLTLQTYAQLFLAFEHYDRFSELSGSPPPTVPLSVHLSAHLSDLAPAGPPGANPDRKEGVLNANVVLRWEFRAGSQLYLVYTREQAPHLDLGPDERGALDLHAVQRAPAIDVLLAKLSYWW